MTNEKEGYPMSSIAIAYFSATGTTARVAKVLAQALDADLHEIVPAQPYTHQDLNWNSASSRSSVEMKDPAARPALAASCPSLSQYDVIFLGFPIWWYEAPRLIQTFLENGDWEGKTIIPFATSGGRGLGNTESILQKSAPTAHFLPGKRLSASFSVQDAKRWALALQL